MRKLLIISTFTLALLVSAPAHALLDCWTSYLGDTVCQVLSVSGPRSAAEQAVTCDDAAWFAYDFCPVVEDTGDGTEDDFLLCEDAPLLLEELCDSQ